MRCLERAVGGLSADRGRTVIDANAPGPGALSGDNYDKQLIHYTAGDDDRQRRRRRRHRGIAMKDR